MIRLTTLLIVFALCSASASASKTNNAESALSTQKIGAVARLRSTIRKLEDAEYYQQEEQEEEEEEAEEYYEEEGDEAEEEEEEEEEDEEAVEYYEEEEEEAAEEGDDAAAEEGDDAAAEGDDDAEAEEDDDAEAEEDDDAEAEYYDGDSSSVSQKVRDYSTKVTNKVNNDYLPEGYDITENELIYFVVGSIGAIALVIIYLNTRQASQEGKEGDDYVRSDLIKNEDAVSA
jgi:hypothetical protein